MSRTGIITTYLTLRYLVGRGFIDTYFSSVPFEAQVLTVIAVSRTPLWLPSGWGCRGRRLSKARRNPDTRLWPWQCRPARRERGRGRDGRVRRLARSR